MSLTDSEVRVLQASVIERVELQNETMPPKLLKAGRDIDALIEAVTTGQYDEGMAAGAFVWIDQIKDLAAGAGEAARATAETIGEGAFSEPDHAAGFERRAQQLRNAALLVDNLARIARLRVLAIEAGFVVEVEDEEG